MGTSESDIELVGLARSEDKDAFGKLAGRHLPLAEHVALRVVRQKHIAQELAQEAVLQAYLSLDRLRNDDRFESWLYGIVLNVSRSYLRNQRIDFLSLERMEAESSPDFIRVADEDSDPEAAVEANELRDAVLRAVESLSEKNRSAVLLYYYEGFTIHEVSEILGVSETATKGRLHKSRTQLRPQLRSILSEFGRLRQVVSEESRIDNWRRVASIAAERWQKMRTGKRRSNMAEVVSSQLPTCPSCSVQTVIRMWSCGCQGCDGSEHLESCETPNYFDRFPRYCQELQEYGKNPQSHLRLVTNE